MARAGVGVVAAREGVGEGSGLGVPPGPSWSPQEDHPTRVDPWQGVEVVQALHAMVCTHQTRQATDFQKAGVFTSDLGRQKISKKQGCAHQTRQARDFQKQGVEVVLELHTIVCAHQTRQAKGFQEAGV